MCLVEGWMYAHEETPLCPDCEVEGESPGSPAPGEKQLCCIQAASPELVGALSRQEAQSVSAFH